MIILNKEEIQKCLPMKEAIKVCKESLKDYSENKTNIPLSWYKNSFGVSK